VRGQNYASGTTNNSRLPKSMRRIINYSATTEIVADIKGETRKGTRSLDTQRDASPNRGRITDPITETGERRKDFRSNLGGKRIRKQSAKLHVCGDSRVLERGTGRASKVKAYPKPDRVRGKKGSHVRLHAQGVKKNLQSNGGIKYGKKDGEIHGFRHSERRSGSSGCQVRMKVLNH